MSAGVSSWSQLAERLRLVCTQPALIPRLASDYVPEGAQSLFSAMRGDAQQPLWYYRNLSAPRALSLYPGTPRPVLPGSSSVTGLPHAGGLPLSLFREVSQELRRQVEFDGDTARGQWYLLNHQLHLPLTREEIVRRRYIPAQLWRPDVVGPRFSLGLGLLIDVLPSDRRTTLIEWLDRLCPYLARCTSSLTVVAIFKAVEGWAKTSGDLFSHWKVPCGLALLGGYQPAPPLEFFKDDVEEWVSGPLPDIGATLPGWRDSFIWASEQLLAGCEPCSPPLTYEQYVLKGEWVRPGATDQGNFPLVMSGGQPVGFRRTKTAMYAASTPEQLLALAYAPAAPPRAMVKRELTKARAVVITDTPSYLRMSWISTAVEPLLRRSQYASVFFSGDRLAQLWAQLAIDSEDVSLWKCPIDQSKFDHMVEPWALSVILDRISEIVLGQQASFVVDMIRKDLLPANGTVVVGGESVPVTKGVLSGWRWTALLDTWVNFSQVVGSLHYLCTQGIINSLNITGWFFQGDDARLVTRNPGIAVAVAEVMREAGLHIHPAKTWLSPFRDEYLRQVAEDRVTSGYLARSIPSLLWRNPINVPADTWPAAAHAAVGRWDGLVLRGAKAGNVLRHAMIELGHLVPYSRSTIEKWLALPSHLGGAGVVWAGDYFPRVLSIRYPERVSTLHFQRMASLARLVSTVPELPHGDVVAGCIKYFSQAIDTYEPKARYLRVIGDVRVPQLEWDDAPPPWPPLGAVPFGAPPARPTWRSDLTFPNWFRNVIIDVAIRHKVERVVEGFLEPYSAGHSIVIRTRHGRGTWADWVKGALTLPTRPWPGWDKGYLTTLYARRVDTFIRCYLGSSRRWGGRARLASERFFYSIQRCPDGVLCYKIMS